MTSQTSPIPMTSPSTRKVAWYLSPSGALWGSTGVIISNHSDPMTPRLNTRVSQRPNNVGTIECSSDLLVARPAQPFARRADRIETPDEAEGDEVVHDVLGRKLKTQERVNAGEVAPQRRRTRRVHTTVAIAGAAHLERPLHVQPAHRVAARSTVLEQVRQQAVLLDVGF